MVATQRLTTVAGAISIAMVCMASSHAHEPSPLERFRREAPRAWSELMALASCVEGEASSTKTDRITGKTLWEVGASRFRINGHLAYHSFGKGTMIHCQNQDYAFVVEDKKSGRWAIKQLHWNDRRDQGMALQPLYDSGDGAIGNLPWQIARAYPWNDRGGKEAASHPYCDPSDGTLGHEPWQMALALACRGIIINTTWLPHLAASATFKVVDATYVQSKEGGRELVHINFTNEAKRGPGPIIERGEITLDPQRFWQIVEARVMTHYGHEGPKQYDCELEIKNEFEVADQRLPYLGRQTARLQCLPVVDHEDVYKTKVALRDKQDVKPFTLSAFGLAEPAQGRR